MNYFSSDKRMLVYGFTESHPDIFSFSTTRLGGFSGGNYASFNCNHYCGDLWHNVKKNRELLNSILPQKPDMLIIPYQTHGIAVRVIDETFVNAPEEKQVRLLEKTDAVVGHIPGLCLCVSTADCIPLLYYDVRHKVVAAVHAGWRGTVNRIAEQTLHVMHNVYGTQGKDVMACIGPGISQEAFEVGEEVYAIFEQSGFDMRRIACMYEKKWHIDLWEANRLQLLENGVLSEHIEIAGICTYSHHDLFFSARKLGIHSGRILSGIMIMKN